MEHKDTTINDMIKNYDMNVQEMLIDYYNNFFTI
jgi:hypothetical protein